MFRKPPSKLEQLQNTLSHTLDSLHDTIDSLPLDRVKGAKDSAVETVSHGWEAALHRAADAVHAAADAAGSVASTVGAAAGNVAHKTGSAAHHARDAAAAVAHSAADHAGSVASRAAEGVSGARDIAARAGAAAAGVAARAGKTVARTGSHAHDAAEDYAGHARESAANAVENAAETRDEWLDGLHNKKKNARKLAKRKQQEAHDAAERAVQEARNRAHNVQAAHVVVQDSTSKWLWIGVGLLAGAALALLFAPTSGRRSRALIQDKVKKAKNQVAGLGEAAADKAGHVGKQAASAVHEHIPTTEAERNDADDITIADRVRTAIGEHPATRNLERLNIDSVNGVVTLRGPIADAELQAQIEEIVRGVKGVKEVQSHLLLEESADDAPTFVG